MAPGEIVTARPRKHWRYAGHPYLSGDIEGTCLDVAALGLAPLHLEPFGTWDPAEEYWGEEGEAVDDWTRNVIAHGPRPEFEMEQVLPGTDPNDPDIDPIVESNELKEAGDVEGARRILMALLEADLRCLDAHAHLGNQVFDHRPEEALRHYEVGVRIGELSLGGAGRKAAGTRGAIGPAGGIQPATSRPPTVANPAGVTTAFAQVAFRSTKPRSSFCSR